MRGSDTGMDGQSLFTEIIKNWWESFPPRSRSRGNIAGGLVILRVSVESIESFVSQNIEELSDFAGDKVSQNIKLLLEKYNERVAEVETDLSLQIRIPAALER